MPAEFFSPFRRALCLPAFAARLLGFAAGVGMMPLATAQGGFVAVTLVFDAGGDDWDHLAMDNLHTRMLQSPVMDAPQNVGIVREADGKIRSIWRGTPGATYRVEVSPDLLGWEPAATVAAADSGLFEFLDSPAPTAAPRFYRGARP